MRACENVIVTVQAGDRAFDMELPAFLPIKELVEKVDETLRNMPSLLLSGVQCVGLACDGSVLEADKTLAYYGVWDGRFIACVLEREVAAP